MMTDIAVTLFSSRTTVFFNRDYEIKHVCACVCVAGYFTFFFFTGDLIHYTQMMSSGEKLNLRKKISFVNWSCFENSIKEKYEHFFDEPNFSSSLLKISQKSMTVIDTSFWNQTSSTNAFLIAVAFLIKRYGESKHAIYAMVHLVNEVYEG